MAVDTSPYISIEPQFRRQLLPGESPPFNDCLEYLARMLASVLKVYNCQVYPQQRLEPNITLLPGQVKILIWEDGSEDITDPRGTRSNMFTRVVLLHHLAIWALFATSDAFVTTIMARRTDTATRIRKAINQHLWLPDESMNWVLPNPLQYLGVDHTQQLTYGSNAKDAQSFHASHIRVDMKRVEFDDVPGTARMGS